MKTSPFSLTDKIVVLTGGSGRLGRVFSEALIERGARVASFDLREPAAGFSRERFMAVCADVTSRASLEKGLAAVTLRWGAPHGLVNAAAIDAPPGSGAGENGPFESYPESSWDRVIDVNLKGVFQTCQVVGAAMARKKRGSIVNIGSIYGLVSPDQRVYAHERRGRRVFFKPAAYSASKSALLNLTRYLSTYWAGRNLRVNTLTFGGVRNGQDPRFVKEYSRRVPLGRMARPAECAGGLVFLLSDASSYMTGANLVIDGGWTAW